MKNSTCVYCGATTNGVAGDPMVWPVWFPEYETGIARSHCMKCVIERCRLGDELAAKDREIERLRGALQVFAEPKHWTKPAANVNQHWNIWYGPPVLGHPADFARKALEGP
jgi:hypothetical protein